MRVYPEADTVVFVLTSRKSSPNNCYCIFKGVDHALRGRVCHDRPSTASWCAFIHVDQPCCPRESKFAVDEENEPWDERDLVISGRLLLTLLASGWAYHVEGSHIVRRDESSGPLGGCPQDVGLVRMALLDWKHAQQPTEIRPIELHMGPVLYGGSALSPHHVVGKNLVISQEQRRLFFPRSVLLRTPFQTFSQVCMSMGCSLSSAGATVHFQGVRKVRDDDIRLQVARSAQNRWLSAPPHSRSLSPSPRPVARDLFAGQEMGGYTLYWDWGHLARRWLEVH